MSENAGFGVNVGERWLIGDGALPSKIGCIDEGKGISGRLCGNAEALETSSATLEVSEFFRNVLHILDVPLPTPVPLLPPSPTRRLRWYRRGCPLNISERSFLWFWKLRGLHIERSHHTSEWDISCYEG